MIIKDSTDLLSLRCTPKLSLAQKLALFDSEKHTGEVMLAVPLGKEAFECELLKSA